MTSKTFTRDELAAAFSNFEATVGRAAQTRDWDPWVEQYSPDVTYVEHAAGTMKGREAVRAWICDESTGRIVCELDNPMRDPGDGTIISATNISIVTYAGDGQWSRQEDIYNPLRFVSATMKWCRKAQELGTLPHEAAAWMRQFGDRK